MNSSAATAVAEIAGGQREDDWIPHDTFGARLALVRQEMGWNVKEAAEACGLAVQNWRNWEAGRSPRDIHKKAQQIADRTGCDYVWLVAGGRLRTGSFSTIDGNAGQGVLFDDETGPTWSDRADLALVS